MNAQKEMYLLRNRYSTTLSREEIENLSLWAQKRPRGDSAESGENGTLEWFSIIVPRVTRNSLGSNILPLI